MTYIGETGRTLKKGLQNTSSLKGRKTQRIALQFIRTPPSCDGLGGSHSIKCTATVGNTESEGSHPHKGQNIKRQQ